MLRITFENMFYCDIYNKLMILYEIYNYEVRTNGNNHILNDSIDSYSMSRILKDCNNISGPYKNDHFMNSMKR